ncbi:hypothetical protein GCM10011579_003990 [Streptomyces albiflavescens]|uniref:Uncharacterized protein n=1 Tax=Streptomyces albiflavescens TaxID=1623582 RepID=A0A917XR18_9ACTN|nr:hypothetical protein GCM10011579_003990 [Streptomyces albiflavescens]
MASAGAAAIPTTAPMSASVTHVFLVRLIVSPKTVMRLISGETTELGEWLRYFRGGRDGIRAAHSATSGSRGAEREAMTCPVRVM